MVSGHRRGQSSQLVSPIREISVGQNNFEFHPQHKKLTEEYIYSKETEPAVSVQQHIAEWSALRLSSMTISTRVSTLHVGE